MRDNELEKSRSFFLVLFWGGEGKVTEGSFGTCFGYLKFMPTYNFLLNLLYPLDIEEISHRVLSQIMHQKNFVVIYIFFFNSRIKVFLLSVTAKLKRFFFCELGFQSNFIAFNILSSKGGIANCFLPTSTDEKCIKI